LLGYCDNIGEPLAAMMRRGSAGSNTTADHLQVLVTRSPRCRRSSAGWELGARERAAIGLVPPQAWQIAIDQRGEVRERRADGACAGRSCGHARCWVEEAHVTELTGLLREGPHGTGWRAGRSPGSSSSPWTAIWPAPSRRLCVTGSCMLPGSWSAAAADGG
jgi:hypothetical protein